MVDGCEFEEPNEVEGTEPSAHQKRALLLVGYSYFFENFFSKAITSLRGEWTFDVWFDSHPKMFAPGDYESARSLESSEPFGEIRCLPLSMERPEPSFSDLRDFLSKSKADVERLTNLARSRGYEAVITMNSALPAVLPLIEALKGLELKLIVVRATILEAPLLLLFRPFFAVATLTSLQILWLRILAFWRSVATLYRKVVVEARQRLRKIKDENPALHHPLVMMATRSFLWILPTTPLFTATFLHFMHGVRKPLRAVLQAEYAFANPNYTDFVITPGKAHLGHMGQFLPGPQYLSYTRFFDNDDDTHSKSEENLNILLPLFRETSPGAISLLKEIVRDLMTIRGWSSVRYRMHPRDEGLVTNLFLQELLGKISCPTEDVSDLPFADFSLLDGRFLVVGSTSAITSLSLFSPGAEIGVVSIDRGPEPGEDGRYLEEFGNSCLLRTASDVEDWLHNRRSTALNPQTSPTLESVLRRALEE